MISYQGEYVICLCEGNFERAVFDLLLENNYLFFDKSQLGSGLIVDRNRSAKAIQVKYLSYSYDKPVKIIRLIDSKNEKFQLSPSYSYKVNGIHTCLTRRSIEILIIISEGHYEKYTQSKIDSCEEYINRYLGFKDFKSYEFVRQYFSDINKLICVLKQYKKFTKKKELCIADLLK